MLGCHNMIAVVISTCQNVNLLNRPDPVLGSRKLRDFLDRHDGLPGGWDETKPLWRNQPENAPIGRGSTPAQARWDSGARGIRPRLVPFS